MRELIGACRRGDNDRGFISGRSNIILAYFYRDGGMRIGKIVILIIRISDGFLGLNVVTAAAGINALYFPVSFKEAKISLTALSSLL